MYIRTSVASLLLATLFLYKLNDITLRRIMFIQIVELYDTLKQGVKGSSELLSPHFDNRYFMWFMLFGTTLTIYLRRLLSVLRVIGRIQHLKS